MSKVTLTITDTPTGINLSVDFDPPYERVEDATNAQLAAARAIEALKSMGSSSSRYFDDDGEYDLEDEDED